MSLSATSRITLGLVGLMTSLVFVAYAVGLFPDRRADIVQDRKQLCESMAIAFSAMANHYSKEQLADVFEQIAERGNNIESIGIRLQGDDALLLEIGDHDQNWSHELAASSERYVSVPLYKTDGEYGRLEVRYTRLFGEGLLGYLWSPEVQFAAFLAVIGFAAFSVYLRTVLRQLNPKKAIPKRVREALDTLGEGLLIMDQQERIVLANESFQRVTGLSQDLLLGKKATEIPFLSRGEEVNADAPWDATLSEGVAVRGRLLGLEFEEDGQSTTFSVSCSPILDDRGNHRGAIASFEDVTQLERKKNELIQVVERLNQSTAEIKRQNRELEILATRDSLTGCCNRRYFFQEFDVHWEKAAESSQTLSAIMVDIDHFKSINDDHGHAIGDEVLRAVGQTLDAMARQHDIVSRYGGEEFAVLLPSTSLDEATSIAEKMRLSLASLQFSQLSITASLGVSSIDLGAKSPQELLEQADKCLYMAKRNGRNQVVRWDSVPPNLEMDESKISRTRDTQSETSVPFRAVTALISALASRDQNTANHSRRVADLCVAVAEGLLPLKDCYILEIAGLLHDVGKIGVPESILTKLELTSDEQEVLRHYDRIGASLVATTFDCTPLTQIVSSYRRDYESSLTAGGERIPIGARILAIADAYDAMLIQQSNKNEMAQRDAFAMLRGEAGTRFDPELVERFIYVVKLRAEQSPHALPQVSKDAALSIGLQMERLVDALDSRDPKKIVSIAKHIQETADTVDGEIISQKAAQVATLPEADGDLFAILQTASELLDLCRLSQRSLLQMEQHVTTSGM